jgi:hypothetical protein
MKKQRKIKRAKAQAAANRNSYFELALGAGIVAGMAVMALLAIPTGAPREMVRAQALRETDVNVQAKAIQPSPQMPKAARPIDGEAIQAAGITAGQAAVAPVRARPTVETISFQRLAAFPFVVTTQMLSDKKDSWAASEGTLRQIPDEVKALNGREVALQGFILPMKFEHGLATEFLLMRNQNLCCYGVTPKITEWVNVRSVGGGIKPVMDQPVTVVGTFHVGEVRENGDLVGIYSLDGRKVTLE